MGLFGKIAATLRRVIDVPTVLTFFLPKVFVIFSATSFAMSILMATITRSFAGIEYRLVYYLFLVF